MPDGVGSVTTIARWVPVIDEITGQPIPGGPSMRIKPAPTFIASSRASFLTAATSFPELSSPGSNSA